MMKKEKIKNILEKLYKRTPSHILSILLIKEKLDIDIKLDFDFSIINDLFIPIKIGDDTYVTNSLNLISFKLNEKEEISNKPIVFNFIDETEFDIFYRQRYNITELFLSPFLIDDVKININVKYENGVFVTNHLNYKLHNKLNNIKLEKGKEEEFIYRMWLECTNEQFFVYTKLTELGLKQNIIDLLDICISYKELKNDFIEEKEIIDSCYFCIKNDKNIYDIENNIELFLDNYKNISYIQDEDKISIYIKYLYDDVFIPHNENGPTYINKKDIKYFLEGIEYTKKDFEIRLRENKLKRILGNDNNK